MTVTPEMIEAFGHQFWPVNAVSKIEAQRDEIERALNAALSASPAPAVPVEQFPQPRRKDGKEPCGECHIQPGETCDICGARHATTAEALLEKAREALEFYACQQPCDCVEGKENADNVTCGFRARATLQELEGRG